MRFTLIYIKLFSLTFILSLFVLYLSAFTYISLQKDRTIPWLQTIGSLNFSNLSRDQVAEKLEASENDYSITLHFGNYERKILGSEIDVSINTDKNLEHILGVGHDSNYFVNLYKISTNFLNSQEDLTVSYDQSLLQEKIDSLNFELLRDVVNGKLEINLSQTKYEIIEPQIGIYYKKADLSNSLPAVISNLDKNLIIETETEEPTPTSIQYNNLKRELERLWLSDATIEVKDKSLHLTSQELSKLALLTINDANIGQVTIDANDKFTWKWEVTSEDMVNEMIGLISKTFNQEMVEGKIRELEGKTLILSHSQSGINVKESLTRDSLERFITSGGEEEFKVSYTQDDPERDTYALLKEDPDKYLELTQVIGTGKSRFPNTSWARVTNIKAGLARLNNFIVEPHSEFSLYEGLDGINPKDGYVIGHALQGGRVVDSYAGGVCQIATTLFRAALESGFEITERHNHSMSLSMYTYPYDKNVVDAAVYFSKNSRQDLKFMNDSNEYLLISTSIELNKSDNYYYPIINIFSSPDFEKREVEMFNFSVWGYRNNPNTIKINDPSLEPGVKIKVQSAVPGNSGSFERKVTLGGEVLFEDKFVSKYSPYAAAYKMNLEAEAE